ncbi:MAG: NAD-dependent epimerase/dehydratase family protein [Patescibacteria group bacterium]|nr:NAD-dependent epimerase/dehydratase family protein [Patescibacteria group bacterium]MDE2438447.1 NAD-dependent epimerase/dehydratase family protein [Patescibacteria group bacterium]
MPHKKQHINIRNLLITGGTSIKAAMRTIDRFGGYGIVFVVSTQKKLIGVVSDGDIRRALSKGFELKTSVQEIMTRDFTYVIDTWSKEKIGTVLKSKTALAKGPFVKVPVIDANHRPVDMLFVLNGSILSFNAALNSHTVAMRQIKKILVVGGAGYIGSVLTRLLLSAGYSVVVLDSFLYGHDSLRDVMKHKKLKVIRGDTRHTEDIVAALQGVHAVAHLAELVGDPACAVDPKTTQQINYFATRQLASICKFFQINRFIYFSSCSVYGASSKHSSCNEESTLNPVSLYAKVKVASEHALLEMEDSNFSPTIFRLATVFGASFRPRFDLVVNILSAKAVVEHTIPILGGSQWRPHVHVEDVGRAVLLALEAPLSKVGGQIFNVGSNALNYTIKDIGAIVRATIPEAVIDMKKGDGDMRNYRADFSKIASVLTFRPEKTIQDGVREIQSLITSGKVKDYTQSQYSNIKFLEKKLKTL